MGKPKTPRALADNEARAVLRTIRVSPQKLNLVAALIRGKKVATALNDLEFSRKRIAGTVKEDGSPDVPVKRRVRLHREQDGFLIREVWSHPVTGAYSFDYIDATQRYTVITYDYEHDYRAVIADNITPEAMP